MQATGRLKAQHKLTALACCLTASSVGRLHNLIRNKKEKKYNNLGDLTESG